jgi:DNA polymerase-3 subunit delta'
MWKIRGYPREVGLLKKVTLQDLPCAYLILGPLHVGKTTLALDLACLMNCEGRERPCGSCSSCRRITQGKHPDVVIISPREGKEEVGIDQIREMERETSIPPFEGAAKVFIIQERLSLEAANSLLKTLEEPPPKVLFILTSSHREALPLTIISRCQEVELYPLAFSTVQRELQDMGASQDQAKLLAHMSGGKMGWAISALRDGGVVSKQEEILKDLVCKIGLSIGHRLKGLDVPQNLDGALGLWEGLWRDVLLFQTHCPDFIQNQAMMPEIKGVALNVKPSQVKDFLLLLSKVRDDLRRNANPRILLELLLINMPYMEEKVGRIHSA